MKGRLNYAAILFCAAAVPGCAYSRLPRIDPSGQSLFIQPTPVACTETPCSPSPCPTVVPCPAPAMAAGPPRGYHTEPGPVYRGDDVAVTLTPHRTVVPVGSEVVLIAGVRNGDGYLSTNRRLEWSITPGSVGNFVAVGGKSCTDYLVADFTQPRKVSNTYAIGDTSRRAVRLDRGTPTPADDVYVGRGQGWISVTSPAEGTSNVMVYSPDVVPWEGRVSTATIHWIDAQFGFPPPAINPAGTRHVFTTTVLRQSNHCPHVGWIVRYEITGGPPAGFEPDGAQAVEVPTNSAGQACAAIIQKQPTHGTNQICIQVIRPAVAGGPDGERLVVGNGSTLKTWTAAGLAVRTAGPPTAAVGSTLTYCIEVCNPGDLPAREVTVVDEVPAGLTFVSATPTPETTGKRLQWRLPDLGPGQRQVLQVKMQVGQPGSVTNCAEVTAAGGLKASDCATTTVMAASSSIDVVVRGPEQVNVGDRFTAEVVITNRGQTPATGLTIKDRFGDGLEAEASKPGPAGEQQRVAIPSPIERALNDLAPGQSQRIGVTFRVTRPGRLCHTVEVLGGQGVVASAEGCVTGVGEGAAPPGETAVTPPPSGPAKPAAPAEQTLAVNVSGPNKAATVGETVEFVVLVTNNGSQALNTVKIACRLDAGLEPTVADPGVTREDGDVVWKVPTLTSGTTVTRHVQCKCSSPAVQAFNRVTVTAAGGVTAQGSASVEIRAPGAEPKPPGPAPAAGALALAVGEFTNPVTAGSTVTYWVRVTNKGTEPDSQVVLKVLIPAEVTLDRFATSGPKSTTSDYSPADRAVTFTAVAELRPGATVEYRIAVKTKQPGQVRIRAEVASRNQTQPLVQEKTTQVFQSED